MFEPTTPAPAPGACSCGATVEPRWHLGVWRMPELCGDCVDAQRIEDRRALLGSVVRDAIARAGYPALAVKQARGAHSSVPDALAALRYQEPAAPSWAHIIAPYGSGALVSVIAYHARVVARAHMRDVPLPSARALSERAIIVGRRPDVESSSAGLERRDLLVVYDCGHAPPSDFTCQEWLDIVTHRVDCGLPTITIGPHPVEQMRAPHWGAEVKARIRHGMRGHNQHAWKQND